ncbi:major tail tube protein [Vibrio phage vB_VpaS_KF4]|nr:major tail tube protein [Vibrio phage vB_VpaS_KF4]
MSDTNRVRLAIIEETTPGTVPNNPKLVRQRVTNMPSLAVTPETIESEELDPTMQTTDLIKVGQAVGGEFGMEFSYDAQKQTMIGIMRNSWNSFAQYVGSAVGGITAGKVAVTDSGDALPVGALVLLKNFNNNANNGVKPITAATKTELTITGVVADTSKTGKEAIHLVGLQGGSGHLSVTANSLKASSSSTIDFTKFKLREGSLIKIGGKDAANRFATAAVNARVRVTKITEKELTLTGLPTGWVADDGASKTIMVWLPEDDIVNGVATKSFTFLQSFLDHNPVTHQIFNGMRVGTMNMEMRSKQIVTFSINAQGTKGAIDEQGLASSTILPASTDVVINTSSNVAELQEGGQKIAGPNYVTGVTLSLNNNPRNDDAIGYESPVNIGGGTFQLTGTVNTYFGNKSMVEKVINNSETSLLLDFKDGHGQHVVFDMPRVKYSSGSPAVSGKNAANTADLGYTALKHPDYGYTLGIQKFRYME